MVMLIKNLTTWNHCCIGASRSAEKSTIPKLPLPQLDRGACSAEEYPSNLDGSIARYTNAVNIIGTPTTIAHFFVLLLLRSLQDVAVMMARPTTCAWMPWVAPFGVKRGPSVACQRHETLTMRAAAGRNIQYHRKLSSARAKHEYLPRFILLLGTPIMRMSSYGTFRYFNGLTLSEDNFSSKPQPFTHTHDV